MAIERRVIFVVNEWQRVVKSLQHISYKLTNYYDSLGTNGVVYFNSSDCREMRIRAHLMETMQWGQCPIVGK